MLQDPKLCTVRHTAVCLPVRSWIEKQRTHGCPNVRIRTTVRPLLNPDLLSPHRPFLTRHSLSSLENLSLFPSLSPSNLHQHPPRRPSPLVGHLCWHPPLPLYLSFVSHSLTHSLSIRPLPLASPSLSHWLHHPTAHTADTPLPVSSSPFFPHPRPPHLSSLTPQK